MLSFIFTALIWATTNYIDSPVDSRGDGKFRTNIVTRTQADLVGSGWVTNVVTITNVYRLSLKWSEMEIVYPPQFPPPPDEPPRLDPMAAAPATNGMGVMRTTVSLQWDYPTNDVPDVFKLYTSSDVVVPLASWSLVAEVSGTIHNVTISNIAPQQGFYYVKASNWWGESVPSNVAGTPPIPSDINSLRIGP